MRATGHSPFATLLHSPHVPSRALLHLPELRRRHGRWQGKCEACGEWNTITEEGAALARPPTGRAPRKGRIFTLEALTGETHDAPRLATGIDEFDRVCGGGFVPGSALLIGGDPGVGKSTLLLRSAPALARRGARPSTSPARRPWRRCGCAPSAWAWRTRRSRSPPNLGEDIVATL